MKAGTIVKMHRLVGLGMDPRAVEQLADDHMESVQRRGGLPARSHAEFLVNSVVHRLTTSPSSDLGGHFMPALFVTGVGMAIYVAGGRGAKPSAPPTWPMVPLVLGLIWLLVQTGRASGFPTRGAIAPALLTSFGAVADAMVMPIVLPEDNSIRVGLLIFAVACPVVFLRLGARTGARLSWTEVRGFLNGDRMLRSGWHLLSISLVCIAVGEILAIPRLDLPSSFRIGAVVSGLGLAWMARSFHLAARTPATC